MSFKISQKMVMVVKFWVQCNLLLDHGFGNKRAMAFYDMIVIMTNFMTGVKITLRGSLFGHLLWGLW